MDQHESEKLVDSAVLWGPHELSTPGTLPYSHGEIQERPSCGFCLERGRVIVVNYSPRVLHKKSRCLRKRT